MDTLKTLLNKARQAIEENSSIFEIDKVLTEIAKFREPSCIGELIRLFDDEYKFDEVMFSIIHLIEGFDDNVYVKEVVKSSRALNEKSPRWAYIIFLRILNNDRSLEVLKEEFLNASEAERQGIIFAFQNLEKKYPNKFSEKIKRIFE